MFAVSPLSAVMREQLQSIVQNEGNDSEKSTSVVFTHPEVYVDINSVGKMFKRKGFNRIVQDGVYLVLQWYRLFLIIVFN